MSALLALALTNRYFIAAVSCLLGAGALYYKGYRQGKNQADVAQQNAALNMAKQIEKTESQNQNIQAEGQKNAENVNVNADISQLIGLWNQLTKQTPGNKTDPKP